jgi:hypothetical protein
VLNFVENVVLDLSAQGLERSDMMMSMIWHQTLGCSLVWRVGVRVTMCLLGRPRKRARARIWTMILGFWMNMRATAVDALKNRSHKWAGHPLRAVAADALKTRSYKRAGHLLPRFAEQTASQKCRAEEHI